jgi:hypothetical protein
MFIRVWSYCVNLLNQIAFYFCCREDNWGGKGAKNGGTEDRAEREGEPVERGSDYDGPPGMDPDGVIESNWDKVIIHTFFQNLTLWMDD